MRAFVYGAVLQWKLDLRNKGILLTYYIIPLVFFGFMGAIFSSIDPSTKDTLIQSMTIFGVTMGAVLGAPSPLVDLYNSEVKKAFVVGGIPLWVVTVNNFISAFIHIILMSLVIFIAAPVAFSAEVPANLLIYFFSLAVFIIVSLAVGTVLGLFIKSTSKLTMVSQFIFLPSLMLSGIMFPVNLLPAALESAGKIFPATWGLLIMTKNTFHINFYMPLIIIFIISVCASAYRLSKMGVE